MSRYLVPYVPREHEACTFTLPRYLFVLPIYPKQMQLDEFHVLVTIMSPTLEHGP